MGEGALGWLETFALALGEGHQVVYSAYDTEAGRLARYLASGQALLISTPELAFSEEETRTYLSGRESKQDSTKVHRHLDGWPAGVGLAAAEVSHTLTPDELLQSALERALPAAEREQNSMLPLLIETHADIFMSQTAFKEATVRYQEALPLAQSHELTPLVQRICYCLSDAARRSNHPTFARHMLTKAYEGGRSDYVYLEGYREFYGALDAFSRGNRQIAQRKFEMAVSSLQNLELEIRAYVYLLELVRQEGALGQNQVVPLIGKLNALGHDAVLWIDAEPLQLLYKTCVENGWFAERFAPFTKPRTGVDLREQARPVLNIQTLGKLRLELNRTPVKLPFMKAGELLVWLALHGPATREQIVDALWDGSRAPKHVEYARVALRRLRSSLAEHVTSNPLPYTERSYQLSENLEIKLDVKDTLKALETGSSEERREALERYRSAFLPNVTSEWAEGVRAKLHHMALTTSIGLGAAHERLDPKLALWAYRKAVEIDPFFVDGHSALIKFLHSSGDLMGVRLAYDAYARVLEDEYGEAPDISLKELLPHVSKAP